MKPEIRNPNDESNCSAEILRNPSKNPHPCPPPEYMGRGKRGGWPRDFSRAESNPNDEIRNGFRFVILVSDFIRHSDFGFRIFAGGRLT